jgi:TonB family protein
VSDEPDLKETEEKEVGPQDPIIERTELVSEREVNGEVKIKDGENKPFFNDNAISEDSESKKTNSAFIIKIITIIVVIAGAITIGIVSNHNHGAEPSYDATDTICQADTMEVEVEPQDSVQLEIGSFSADAKANIPNKKSSEKSAATSDKDVNNRGYKEIVELRIVEDKANQGAKENGPVNVAMVEQKPSFPGGDAAMKKWLGENISYPAAAYEEGVEGRVTVQFIVEKDGSLSNVQVVRRKHPALDAEAVRVVNEMPKWTPGRNNGQPVRVTYNLPVTFRLQK